MSYLVLRRVQLEGQVVALLVQSMERLDEQVKEEADGIYNTLGKHLKDLNVKAPLTGILSPANIAAAFLLKGFQLNWRHLKVCKSINC